MNSFHSHAALPDSRTTTFHRARSYIAGGKYARPTGLQGPGLASHRFPCGSIPSDRSVSKILFISLDLRRKPTYGLAPIIEKTTDV